MAYSFLGQMFDHSLTILKGWNKSLSHLDFDAPLSSNVNINSASVAPVAGLCVHNTSLGFEMGAKTNQMPIFLWQNGYDFDVSNPGVPAGTALGGTTSVPPAWVPIRPTGKMSGFVATGGFEMETTEFDTAQTYAINDYLRAVTSNTDVNAGRLTNQDASGGAAFATASAAVAYTDTVVGIVSRGVYTNSFGKQVLAFWPFFLPGTR